jgi:glycosyltransferase involved in cell wall biosynthesis
MVAAASAPAGKIGVVLPYRETFSLLKSGALALSCRDFAHYSRFRDQIAILGAADCEYPDVRYWRLVDWRRWWLRGRVAYARAVARAAREAGFSALEIQNRPHMIGRLSRLLPGVKLALHLQNDPQEMEGSRAFAERAALLRRLEAVYCCSDYVRRRFLEGLADEAGKAIVVYNGIATDPAPTAKEPIFAFVGRVIPVKGVVELVKAFALAAERAPQWRLVIAGDDSAGLLAGPRAAVAAEREALGGRLTLMGQVSHAEAMALYARAEIAVVPSLWQEPFGRSAIEAMANGCALIATPVGGLAEIAADAGELVDARDIPAFAATLARVAGDGRLRRELQEKARAKVKSSFDIRRTTAVLDAARARLLGGA